MKKMLAVIMMTGVLLSTSACDKSDATSIATPGTQVSDPKATATEATAPGVEESPAVESSETPTAEGPGEDPATGVEELVVSHPMKPVNGREKGTAFLLEEERESMIVYTEVGPNTYDCAAEIVDAYFDHDTNTVTLVKMTWPEDSVCTSSDEHFEQWIRRGVYPTFFEYPSDVKIEMIDRENPTG